MMLKRHVLVIIFNLENMNVQWLLKSSFQSTNKLVKKILTHSPIYTHL